VAKDAAGKAALLKARNDNYAKAAEMYRKAVELDPNYFEANLNLGYVLLAPGLADYNDAQKLPVNKQKEYNAMMAKASSEFDAAKPYLLKAVELNPKSSEALNNLWTLYKGKRDEAHATEIKKQIDALR
jgi:Flp pilus assembly protein TadD